MDENNINLSIMGGFFRNIKQVHGLNTCKMLKDLMRGKNKLANLRNRRIFLLRCRSYGIIPLHIFNKIDYVYTVCLDDHPFQKDVSNIISNTRTKLLNLEIKITIWKINNLLVWINHVEEQLSVILPNNVWLQTSSKLLCYYERNFTKIKRANLVKFEKLQKRNENSIEQIEEKRIYNFTDVALPQEVNRILNLEPNFGLPISQVNLPVVKIIKDFEGCLNKIKADDLKNEELLEFKNNLRVRGVNVITNYIKNQRRIKCSVKKNLNIAKDVKSTREFLKQHDELLVMRSDKGNSTVVMLKEEYQREMNKMVSDQDTYVKVRIDPTSRFQNIGNKLTKKLVDKGIIDDIHGKHMRTYSALPPRIYGLRKTHKPGCKLRPVVSSIGSPGYEIARFVHEILSPYVMSLKFNVKDSFQFVEKIKPIQLHNDHILISLDVISLFTNVHKSLIRKIIIERWDDIEEFVKIELDLLLELIDFCFDSGYFVFENNFYLQKEGCGMGSPASPSLAIIAVDYVISKAVTILDFNIPVLTAYVDDLFMAVQKNQVDVVLDVFNSIDKDIQFTIEVENNLSLPYLDVLVWRTSIGGMVTSWYHKPYSSGRILNFHSNHPLSQKLGIVQGFLNRAIRLSHESRLSTSVEMVKRLLLNNNYPMSLIKKCERITTERIKHNIRNNAENMNWTFCKFPYVNGLSQRLSSLFRHTNCKLVFYNLSKVKLLYSQLKDTVNKEDKSCLVYKIPCSCDKWYVGQTKQKLKTRLRQHVIDCKRDNYNKTNKTALAVHHFENGHSFQFDKVKVVDYECNYLKRNISEMIFIKALDCVNFRTDTQGLSSLYGDIINVTKNSL